jgi:hypothetical protein
MLEGGRRPRRSGARNFSENRNNQGSDFQPIDDRHDGYAEPWGRDNGNGGRAHRADVRRGRGRSQVRTKVKLRPEEDNREEQTIKARSVG